MGNKRNWVKTILFNLIETICIFLIGHFIGVNIINMCILTLLFALPRQLFNGASHYKKPSKCFIVSLTLGSCFMLMYSINPLLGYLSALFSGIILTEKGNIKNIYQWNKISKYKSVYDFIKENPDNEIVLNYENYMKNKYPFRYKIYEMKYKQNMSLDKMMEEIEIYDRKKIINELNIIYDTLKFSLKIE